jgi:pseudouridine-5'-phosphate glycosidase
MRALVQTTLGLATIDLDEDELVVLDEDDRIEPPAVELDLPLLVAADRSGATIVAVVDRRPPLVVSYDAGATWHEAGGGLPPGRAVAISAEHPDRVLYASASRLHVSLDGGRFWQALTPELPEISAVAWLDF